MNIHTKKIIISTGGSGGHIFPALNVAAELKHHGFDIYFIGVLGAMKSRVYDHGYPCRELPAQGFNSKSIQSGFLFIYKMFKSILHCMRDLSKIKPALVIGFGGYGAFPAVFAASLLGYPTLIHEQNVFPGRANLLLSKRVKKIAISFSQSREYFPNEKTVLTGCPCRPYEEAFNKQEIYKEFSLQENLYTILVFGGSQGSQRINQIFVESLEWLSSKINFQVLHITGEQHYDRVINEYAQIHVKKSIFPFLKEMRKAYTICDLVISRAGAMTVTEIAMSARPSILIPYPYAGNHQKKNAQVLAETHTATVIEEKDLTPEKLCEEILQIYKKNWTRQDIKRRVKDIYHAQAAQMIAEEAMKII